MLTEEDEVVAALQLVEASAAERSGEPGLYRGIFENRRFLLLFDVASSRRVSLWGTIIGGLLYVRRVCVGRLTLQTEGLRTHMNYITSWVYSPELPGPLSRRPWS